MTTENTETDRMHRSFAATANNAAWSMLEQPPAQLDRVALLNAAHAAAWHWEAVGTELNVMRARLLLAQAHAFAGLGHTALALADDVYAYFAARPETPEWELAFVHVARASAACAAGDAASHAARYADARAAMERTPDPEDRAMVELVFRHVPCPEG